MRSSSSSRMYGTGSPVSRATIAARMASGVTAGSVTLTKPWNQRSP
ncbi:hypothetical protein HED54_25905 [Ochrobactrum anthropi ATCC 49188]|nr:hypothetical protein [Brucella anthropi ATCC 49188]